MATAREQVFVAQPIATAGQRVIASPFQFATSEDDNLQIVSANSLAGVVLAIQGRRLTTAGNIEPFAFVHTPNSDRSSKAENYKLGGGALLNLVIFAVTGAPRIGQTYVSARIIRGLSSVTVVLGALLGGYITAAQPLAFPGSPIQNSIEGGGYIRNGVGTQPAAGAEISETVPTGARWELLNFFAVFTTSAAAGNRSTQLTALTTLPTAKVFVPTAVAQAPSTSIAWEWATIGSMVNAAPSSVVAPWPIALGLLAGEKFITVTGGLAAGDQWGTPVFTVQEWLEVQS